MEAQPLLQPNNSGNHLTADEAGINFPIDSKLNINRDDSMRKTTWIGSTQILLGLIMGSGTLGLPYALSQLGWYLGVLLCVAFGIFAVYSGLLLSRMCNRYHPEVEGFADAADAIIGKRFAGFTRWAIWMNWLFLLPYYLMSITHAVEVVIGANVMCFYYRALCVFAALVIPCQLRTLSSLSALGGSSACAIVVAMILILIDFIITKRDPSVITRRLPAADASFLQLYGSSASFIFAFQGQSVFLEVMREMKRPQDFPKAVSAANAVMVCVYLTITLVCYYFKGENLPDFLPDAVSNVWIRRIVGTLVAFNLFSSYLLTQVPLGIAWHERIFPQTARDYTSARARLHWLLITVGLLCFSYVVANAIPFFAAFQDIIGSGLGAPIIFGWPAVFYIVSTRNAGKHLSTLDVALCCLFLGVLLPSCTGIGLFSAVTDLVQGWQNNSLPFSCAPS
eukprot:m.27660 g.27660  ORF g.27660 m.27660 type:complete len:451 (+) comp15786_c1_seq1:172-1524(+)